MFDLSSHARAGEGCISSKGRDVQSVWRGDVLGKVAGSTKGILFLKVIIINSWPHKNQYSVLIFMMHAVIYSGSHPPIEVILWLIHMWSVKTTVGKAHDE